MAFFIDNKIKTFLMTGTALAAVSFFSTAACAAALADPGISPDPTTTQTIGSATGQDGGAGTPTVDDQGEGGGYGFAFGAPLIEITVTGTVRGGNGENGPADADDSGGNKGGDGGIGAGILSMDGTSFNPGGFTSFINNGAIVGGNGGNGGDVGAGSAGGLAGGDGGAGGDAFRMGSQYTRITGTGSFTGGNGGNGGNGTAAGDAGGHGAIHGYGSIGGIGIIAGSSNFEITLTGSGSDVYGGDGGNGGVAVGAAVSGDGGTGAHGIFIIGDNGIVSVDADVIGGNGGNGGDASGDPASTAGLGGNGGIGFLIVGNDVDVTINSSALVKAGNVGANGATNGGLAPSGVVTQGLGIALVGANAVVTNHGTVEGSSVDNGSDAIIVIGSAQSITNDGHIGGNFQAAQTGNGVFIVDYQNAGMVTLASLDNTNGDIDATAGNGIEVSGMFHGAALTTLNSTSGSITATTGTGVLIGGTIGDIINTGTISATTGNALKIDTGGVLSALHNTGGVITSANVAGPGGATVVFNSAAQTALTLNGTIKNTASNNTAEALAILATPTGILTNAGTIQSDGTGAVQSGLGVAVELGAAATFSNSSTGNIYGQVIDSGDVALTLSNAGQIKGNVTLNGAAAHTFNILGGTITGTLTGGSDADDLTLTNATITGAVDLGNDNANTVLVDNGSFTTGNTFTTGGRIATTVTNDGTMSIGHDYTAGSGALAVANGGHFTVTAGTFGSTGAFTSSGASTFAGGASTVGAITNAATGVISLTGGTLASGNITNSGTIHVTSSNLASSGALQNTGGTITIGAGHTLTASTFTVGTGTFSFELNGGTTTTNGTNGQLVITGSAVDLTGAAIKVTVASGSDPLVINSRFKIIDGSTAGATTPAASTVTPVSLGVSGGDTSLYKFYYTTGDYAGTAFGGPIGGSAEDVYILVARNVIDSSIGPQITKNDTVVAAAFTSIGATSDPGITAVQNNLAAASTPEEIHAILEAITPTVDGSAQAGALTVGAQVQTVTDTRIAALRLDDGSTGMAAGASLNGTTLWMQGFGQKATQDERDSIAGYDARTWGAAFGADTRNLVDNGVVGIAFNYGAVDADSKNVNTTATDIDSYGVTLYGTANLDRKTFLNGQLGYAYNNIDTVRHDVNGPGTGVAANGDTHSDQFSAKMELGRDVPVEALSAVVTPSASVAYTYLNTQGYRETGAGANLSVGDSDVSALDLGVGATVAWRLKNQDGSVFKPSIRGAYAYDAIGDAIETTSSFAGVAGSPSFRTTGADPAQSKFNLGVGAAYLSTANWDLSANYNYEFKEDYHAHAGVLRANLHF